MIQFKLNGKKIQIATCWEDLSYNQYYESFNFTGGLLQSVSIASGINYETIKNAKLDGDIDTLIGCMSFFRKGPVWNKPVLKCGPYKLPINSNGEFNIRFESLAQFEDMRTLMNKVDATHTTEMEGAKKLVEVYPSFVAIYLQKIRDGQYNYNKAIQMIPEIKEMPAQEVVTLGSFFLIKLLSLSNGMPVRSPNTAQSQKKSKPVSVSSKKRSALSPRSRKRR